MEGIFAETGSPAAYYRYKLVRLSITAVTIAQVQRKKDDLIGKKMWKQKRCPRTAISFMTTDQAGFSLFLGTTNTCMQFHRCANVC